MKQPISTLFSYTTLFRSQKGFDLIEKTIPKLMTLDAQLVILGTGDPVYEDSFKTLQARYPNQVGVRIGFDEGLAHRIEGDRKSTRLNSSHLGISYAVFCL